VQGQLGLEASPRRAQPSLTSCAHLGETRPASFTRSATRRALSPSSSSFCRRSPTASRTLASGLDSATGSSGASSRQRQRGAGPSSWYVAASLNGPCNPFARANVHCLLFSQDPSNWAAELLLGLERVNHAKLPQTSAKERLVAVRDGLQRVGSAFKNSAQTSAGAAIALSTTYATENGDYERALKLAERAMAFADTRAHFLGGANAMARVHHMRGEAADAERFYGLADNESKHASLIADLGIGQVQLLKGEFLAAKHTFEGVARRWPNEPEVQAMFAALLAHAHPGLSDLERAADRVRARATFDRVQQMIDADAKSAAIADTTGGPSSAVSRDVAADEELFIEMAQAWHGESLERAAKAYKSAARARKDAGRPESPALLNNLGALAMLDGDAATAQGFFEDALTKAAGLDGAALSQQKTTILYNLGRAYEGQGMTEEADNAYRQILNVHPEYPEGKLLVRLLPL